jgi:hypothetical protein
MGKDGKSRVYDSGIPASVSTVQSLASISCLRLEHVFIGACDQASNQVHLAKRSAAVAVQRRFLMRQHGEGGFFGWIAITAILTRPVRPAEYILKVIRHRMSTLACELGWALGRWEVLIA